MRELLWAPFPTQTRVVSAAALYLHGGSVRSQRPVTRTAMTFQRARWLRDANAPWLAESGIASALLRFNVRGWNAEGREPTPLADARWALEKVRLELDVPVVLVGHSMGARTGLRVAGHPGVVGLVALAPWFPADENVDTLQGRHLAVIHGARDRITSPYESSIVAERAKSVTASTSYLALPRLGHYLLSGAVTWNNATRSAIKRIAEDGQEPETRRR